MPRVVHFEISIDNPERAKKFYENVFGWKIEKWGPIDYWLIITGDKSEAGIDGALKKREKPQESTINTISVPSIDEFIEKVKQNGGQVLMPKMTIPGIGYNTYCNDTEGNVFGIIQEDSSAK
jgi:predicted enzyme related to lactoylglutathione lyase